MRLFAPLSLLLCVPLTLSWWYSAPSDAPLAELHPVSDDAAADPQVWLERAQARAAREGARVHLEDGRALVHHQGSGLSLTLDAEGATLVHGDDAPQTVTLQTTALRQGGTRVALDAGAPAVEDCEGPRCRMRAVVDQGALSSWWEHAPDGIEQGWTVPAPIGAGALVVEVQLDLPTRVVDGALQVGAERDGFIGEAISAWDAAGRALEVDAVATLDGFELQVDVEGAAWPVTIDPVWRPWSWQKAGPAGSGFGDAVALDGDVNGDGFADALVGAPGWSGARRSSGRVWLYLGGPAGLSTTAAATWTGTQTDHRLGSAVGFIGDVNGDGLDDFALGADGHDGVNQNEGVVWVFHGTTGALPAAPQVSLTGSARNRRFGGSLDGAGDVNGDGFQDLIASTGSLGQRNEGAAAVWLGGPQGISPRRVRLLRPSRPARLFGYRVAGLGDLDGDGLDEVAVTNGAHHATHIDLYNGRSGGGPSSPARTLADTLPGTITAGDFNGDGHRDVLAHAYPGLSVWWGSGAGLAAAPARVGADYETWSAAAGDMNDDGFDDVLVGGQWGERGEGRVALLWGDAAGLQASPIAFWDSGVSQARLGGSLSMGDVNGDAFSDGLVGASGHAGDTGTTTPTYQRGNTFLLRGGPLGPERMPPTTAIDRGSDTQEALAYGDLNGDGHMDAVVAGPRRVTWQLGSAVGISSTVAGSASTLHPAGRAVSYEDRTPALCDVNGDGADDLLLPSSLRDAAGAWNDMLSFFPGGPGGLGAPATDLLPAFPRAEHDIVRCAGDVSGDGIEDLIVSGGSNSFWELWLGSAAGPVATGTRLGHVLIGAFPDPQVYTNVAVGADVNGDGLADLVASHLRNEELHVFFGRLGGPGVAPDMRWTMPHVPGEARGASVEAAGDVDGDGFDDLLVLAGFAGLEGRRGRVHVAPGGPLGLAGTLVGTWDPLEPTASLDTMLRAVGDMDGDGFDDVALGETIGNNEVPPTSLLAVYRGGPGGLGAAPWFQAPGGLAPSGVEAPGDLNADGRAELLLSVPGAPSSPTWTGAYLFFGDAVAPVLAAPVP
jgi:hypothetical protein